MNNLRNSLSLLVDTFKDNFILVGGSCDYFYIKTKIKDYDLRLDCDSFFKCLDIRNNDHRKKILDPDIPLVIEHKNLYLEKRKNIVFNRFFSSGQQSSFPPYVCSFSGSLSTLNGVIKIDLFLMNNIEKIENYETLNYDNIEFKISTIKHRYKILKELLFDNEPIKYYKHNQKLYIYNKRKIWHGRYKKYLQKFPYLQDAK
jgi:hypothetical protein